MLLQNQCACSVPKLMHGHLQPRPFVDPLGDLPAERDLALGTAALPRGAGGTCRQVLPSLHIGSTANEMIGSNVIRRPHSRKKNQCVMNRQPSTSISGKHHPENYGRGSGPSPRRSQRIIRSAASWARSSPRKRGPSVTWIRAMRRNERSSRQLFAVT
jgi:hypothetical protein